MNLFALKDTQYNRIVPNLFFRNKEAAKVARNAENKQDGDNSKRFVVTYGPDHHRYRRG